MAKGQPVLNTYSSLISPVAALAAVLALVLLAGRAVRVAGLARARKADGPAGSLRRLTLIDTLTLDRTRRLHVVQWQGQDFLLLTGGTKDLVVGATPVTGDQP